MSKVGTGDKKYILIPEAYPLHALGRIFGPKNGPLSMPTPVPIPVIGELLRQSGKEKVTVSEVVPTKVDKRTGRIVQYSEPVRLNLSNYTLPYDEIVNGRNEAAPVKSAVVDPNPDVVIRPEVLTSINRSSATTAAKASPAPVVKEAQSVKEPVVETVVKVNETKTDENVTAPAVPETKVAEEKISTADVESKEQVERANDDFNTIGYVAKIDDPTDTSNATVTVTTYTSSKNDGGNDPWLNMTDDERSEYAKMSKAEKKTARKAHRAE